MQAQLINNLTPNCDSFRVSLYANDAALFFKPSNEDLSVMNCILQLFAYASGLVTNLNKTQAYPIRCDNVNLNFLSNANIPVDGFPCTYLGLPLHYRRPSKSTIYHLMLKIGSRLLGWKRDFFSYPGRELLVKTMLSSVPTYWLIAFKPYKGIISAIDHFRRSFFMKRKGPRSSQRWLLLSEPADLSKTKELGWTWH
jgi:hypothetical protein